MVGRPSREPPIRPAFTSWSQCSWNGASILSSFSSSSIAARSAGRSRRDSGRTRSNRLSTWPASVRSTSNLAPLMVSQPHALQYADFRASDHRYPHLVAAADTRRLQAHERRLHQLAQQLADSGFISSGSVVRRYAQCGTASCRCHGDPPQLHGPYWQWSYRPTGGKTVSRQLNERQALLYQEWIANRRRLLAVVTEMEEVSRQAAELLLSEPHPEPLAATSRLRHLWPPFRTRCRPSFSGGTSECQVRTSD